VSAEAHTRKMWLGGRAIKGGRVRAQDNHTGTRLRDRGKTGEMSRENPCAEVLAPDFPSVYVSRSPPPALEVTGDLDKEEGSRRWARLRPWGGATRCDGGVDERPREEGSSASLAPPIFGKTEVTRELD
jgi:hypothetical protein